MTDPQHAADRRFLPRTLLEPHPDNRKRFDPDALAELRADIAQRGVLDDLLVRPIAGRDGSDGQPLYQIVSGERRWRASEGTPSADALPCKVRDMDDLEALEILLIPNIQAEKLHPLDEAMGYERLLLEAPAWLHHDRPRLKGYSLDDLAGKVHKDRRHIVARLRLLSLTPAARNAFYEREFGIEGALQIARLNTQHQEEVVSALVHDAAKGAPWTADTIAHVCRTRYMLRLAGAPFDLRDAELVPAAGACSTCHKRSGTHPELFDDIAEGDTCADRACHAAKCSAHTERELERARAAGTTVITGDEAARLLPAPDGTVKGYLRLDRPSEFALSNKPLAELLDADAQRDVALIARDMGADTPTVLVRVMPTHAVRQALKAQGLLAPDAAPSPQKKATTSVKPKPQRVPDPKVQRNAAVPAAEPAKAAALDDPELEAAFKGFKVFEPYDFGPKGKQTAPAPARQKQRIETALRDARRKFVLHRLGALLRADGAEGFPAHGLSHIVARGLEYALMHEELVRVAGLAGIGAEHFPRAAMRGKHPIWNLSDEHAARLAIMLLAAQEDWGDDEPQPADVVAGVFDIPTADIEQRARDLVNERARLELLAVAPKATDKKAPAKKTAAPSKTTASGKAKRPGGNAKPPAMRYRNAATGETWSGKGLQPKWLKAALASGKKLADFDLAAMAPDAVGKPKVTLSPAAAWPFPTGAKKTEAAT